MIFEGEVKLTFRQGEYESAVVAGKVIVDTETDRVAESDAAELINRHLDDLIYDNVVAATETADPDIESFSRFYRRELEDRKKEK